MTSTINKNSIGNYELEQLNVQKQADYYLFSNAANGSAYTTYFPGNGLLPARIAPQSGYSCDIESLLYGISSTNLAEPTKKIYGDLDVLKEANHIKNVKSLNIMTKPVQYVPSPLVLDANARPLIR